MNDDMPLPFKEDLNYNAASAIADSLNEIVFGLNEKAAARVVASSMAAQRLRGLTTAATRSLRKD